MELELKHLAGYLPYRLKCHCLGLYIDEEVPKPIDVVICGLSNHCVEILAVNEKKTEWFFINDVLPLLRPLSSLIKEIEVDGVRFVPIEEIFKIWARNPKPNRMSYDIEVNSKSITCSHGATAEVLEIHTWDALDNIAWVVNLLHKWHFDTRRLINFGLAIAIED